MRFMKIDWLEEAQRSANEIMDIREEIHQFPEPGNQEFRTSELIEERLQSYGIPTRRLLGTAVIGELKGCRTAGSSGRTAALRADMDALPVRERTGWAFASRNPGFMHACGHDVHVAAALGAARLLSKYTDCFDGSVRFLFQPDEEGSGGADRLVHAGALEGVRAVFGAHVSPDLPFGTVGIRYGKFYAASDTFSVHVLGRSCHGAEPEKGIDALAAAAEMVLALKALPAGFLPEKSVLTTGMFRSGTAVNILPGEANFSGMIRTLGPETREAMKERLRREIRTLAKKNGVKAKIELKESYPGVVNTDPETRLAEAAAIRLFGADAVHRIPDPTMTTEDFGYYIDAAGGGCFYHIGVGGDHPLHGERFLPPPEAPVLAASMHAETLFSWLEKDRA